MSLKEFKEKTKNFNSEQLDKYLKSLSEEEQDEIVNAIIMQHKVNYTFKNDDFSDYTEDEEELNERIENIKQAILSYNQEDLWYTKESMTNPYILKVLAHCIKDTDRDLSPRLLNELISNYNSINDFINEDENHDRILGFYGDIVYKDDNGLYQVNNSIANKILKDNNLSVSEEDLKDIKVIETNKYYYELTGIFITDKSNNKYIIIYNKYTFQWYYVHMSQWTNKLILPKKLNEVYLVYFRTNKSNKDEINLDVQLNYETNVTLFNDKNKNNDVYWKSFKNIESSYPNILFAKEPFFKSAFNWDETKHLQNDKENNLFVDEEDNEPNTETNKTIEENVPPILSENKIIIPDSLNQNNKPNDNAYNSLGNEEDNKQNTETNQLNDDSDVLIPTENPNIHRDSLNQNNTSNYNSYILFDNETESKPNNESNQKYNNINGSITV